MAHALKKWLENNMGQTESKGTPKTSLTSPVPQIVTPAHHPVQSPKNSTGSSPGHLQVPVQRVRRKSIDSVFEEIFKSNTKSTDPEGCRTPNPSPVKDQKPPKSPLLSAVRKASGWLELPVPGRRSRRPSSSEQGPITIKSLLGRNTGSDDWHDDGLPKIPKNEIFDAPKEVEDDCEETPQFRGRASTIGNGQIPRLANRPKNDSEVVKLDKSKEVKVPVVLRFTCLKKKTVLPENVYVAGTFNEWKSVQMAKVQGETEFNLIMELLPGKYYYKFYANNEWCIDESLPMSGHLRKTSTGLGNRLVQANVVTVKAEDVNVFEALACDSFATRSLESKYSDKEWGQHKPKLDSTNLSSAAGPPIVPPQLTNFVLNQEPPEHRDPVLLPELKSHVMMNHMYAQSIRDQMLVMSTTARYKKKCVTILFYTPIE